jgi:hypothetical protein
VVGGSDCECEREIPNLLVPMIGELFHANVTSWKGQGIHCGTGGTSVLVRTRRVRTPCITITH